VISVGLPFLTIELTSRSALKKAKPSWATHARVLPPVGTDAVFAYVRGTVDGELDARMFAPLDGTSEDPATGSAAAATMALLASLRPARDEQRCWRIDQGVDMGRPSIIRGRTEKRGGTVASVCVSGGAIPVMSGYLELPESAGDARQSSAGSQPTVG